MTTDSIQDRTDFSPPHLQGACVLIYMEMEANLAYNRKGGYHQLIS